MDSAADSLLALSTTAVALADAEQPQDDDDRSSSLSELDGDLDEEVGDDGGDEADDDEEDEGDDVDDEPQESTPNPQGLPDADSEAETERLEESPDKLNRRKSFVATPSKLAQPIQTNHSPDGRPEIESLTESAISSPISSQDDSEDDLSDAPAENDAEQAKDTFRNASPNKRKREDDQQDQEEQNRVRRRRTHSVASDAAKSDRDSEQDGPSRESKDGSAEPTAQVGDGQSEDDEDQQQEEDRTDSKKPSPSNRASGRRKGKDDAQQDTEADADEDVEVEEESDEPADDAEAVAKNEEEQAKRMAAMDGLTVLERHFATLRDRLYDERIKQINHELAQLAESTPSHPELLKQLEAVKKHRDEKFETEQRLLVYKIGALKTKSVAERAQIHSAYYQTIRDIRERHLERLSEHFYRIQRERFKTDSTPTYTIPFATKRSKQITQQTAYNKEVSILSGVAKYVGFPAAPDLMQTSQKDLEDDLQKMGVSSSSRRYDQALTDLQLSASTRQNRPVQRVTSTFSNISAPAAEEQFLEKNPWANAQHPMHRLGLSRQNSNRSPAPETTYLTPAGQQRPAEKTTIMGSASTIAEFPSSQINTPYENAGKPDHPATYSVNGLANSASPLETRQNGQVGAEVNGPGQDVAQETNSSPLASRIGQAVSPPRPVLAVADNRPGRTTASPSIPTKAPGITTGPGFGLGRF